jgi:hypothetical protein
MAPHKEIAGVRLEAHSRRVSTCDAGLAAETYSMLKPETVTGARNTVLALA